MKKSIIPIILSIFFINLHADVWDDIKKQFEQASKTIKHDVEQIGQQVIKTGEEIGKAGQQVVSGAQQVFDPNAAVQQAFSNLGININGVILNGQTIQQAIQKVPFFIDEIKKELSKPDSAIVGIQNTLVPRINEFVGIINQLKTRIDSQTLVTILSAISATIDAPTFDLASLRLSPEIQPQIIQMRNVLKSISDTFLKINNKQLLSSLSSLSDAFSQLYRSIANIRPNLGKSGEALISTDAENLISQLGQHFNNLKTNIQTIITSPLIDSKIAINQFIEGLSKAIASGQITQIMNTTMTTLNNYVSVINQNMTTLEQLGGALVLLSNNLISRINNFGTIKDRVLTSIGASTGTNIVSNALNATTQEVNNIISTLKNDLAQITQNTNQIIGIVQTIFTQYSAINQSFFNSIPPAQLQPIQNVLNNLKEISATLTALSEKLMQR